MTFNPDNPREHEDKAGRESRAATKAKREAAEKPVLEWRQASRWHEATACGRYTVAKAYVHRVPSYSAWFRPGGFATTVPHSLGNHAMPELARAACQAHADKYGGEHPTPDREGKTPTFESKKVVRP